jgi:hypothetical protein
VIQKNVSISRVIYYGTEVSVDEVELINIPNKYSAKRTFQGIFPNGTRKTDIEIDIIDKHKPKHILLGEPNI